MMPETARPFDPELPGRVAALLGQIRAANELEGLDAEHVWVLQDGEDRVSLAEMEQLLDRLAYRAGEAEQLAEACNHYRGERDEARSLARYLRSELRATTSTPEDIDQDVRDVEFGLGGDEPLPGWLVAGTEHGG